jgi:hypothetical protein
MRTSLPHAKESRDSAGFAWLRPRARSRHSHSNARHAPGMAARFVCELAPDCSAIARLQSAIFAVLQPLL